MSTFVISHKEIRRRKIAFGLLSTSLVFGLIIFSTLLLRDYALLAAIYILLLGVFFAVSWVLVAIFFRSYQQTTISISGQNLRRTAPKMHEQFALGDVVSLRVRWTTRDEIRDIVIGWPSGKTISIDGLDAFKKCMQELVAACPQAVVKETHEPLDYDHPWFYPILGTALSLLVTIKIRLLVSLDITATKLLCAVLAFGLLAIAAYFLVGRPLSKRYGTKTKHQDTACGIIALAATAALAWLLIA